MKRGILAAGLALVFAGTAYAGGGDVTGTWKDTEKGSTISVYTCGGGICAKILKVKDAGAKDEKNPNPALRNRPIEGIVIMNGAAKNGENSWQGKLYNREDGETYSGSITLVSKNEIKLEGCVLVFCKSRRWVRAD
jgi:uncharacterized protein (DUF2147 family)